MNNLVPWDFPLYFSKILISSEKDINASLNSALNKEKYFQSLY